MSECFNSCCAKCGKSCGDCIEGFRSKPEDETYPEDEEMQREVKEDDEFLRGLNKNDKMKNTNH